MGERQGIVINIIKQFCFVNEIKMSLINMLNIRGPKIEHWGTPLIIFRKNKNRRHSSIFKGVEEFLFCYHSIHQRGSRSNNDLF